MGNQFETSFIPQQPLLKVEGSMRPRESLNIALVIALVLFFVSIVVSAGVYVYRTQVNKSIAVHEKQLADAEQYFDIDEITKFKHVDTRLTTAKNLVDRHVIFSVILDLLEASTAQNVGLMSLGFAKTGRGYEVSLAAEAPSYAAVYFQRDAWRNMKPMITDVRVSGMSLSQQTGIVSFSTVLTIDPSYLEFSRYLDAQKRAEATLTSAPASVNPPAQP